MLFEVEKAVIDLVYLPVLVIPHRRLVQFAKGMHSQSQEAVPAMGHQIQSFQPSVERPFEPLDQRPWHNGNDLENVLLQLLGRLTSTFRSSINRSLMGKGRKFKVVDQMLVLCTNGHVISLEG